MKHIEGRLFFWCNYFICHHPHHQFLLIHFLFIPFLFFVHFELDKNEFIMSLQFPQDSDAMRYNCWTDGFIINFYLSFFTFHSSIYHSNAICSSFIYFFSFNEIFFLNLFSFFSSFSNHRRRKRIKLNFFSGKSSRSKSSTFVCLTSSLQSTSSLLNAKDRFRLQYVSYDMMSLSLIL